MQWIGSVPTENGQSWTIFHFFCHTYNAQCKPVKLTRKQLSTSGPSKGSHSSYLSEALSRLCQYRSSQVDACKSIVYHHVSNSSMSSPYHLWLLVFISNHHVCTICWQEPTHFSSNAMNSSRCLQKLNSEILRKALLERILENVIVEMCKGKLCKRIWKKKH